MLHFPTETLFHIFSFVEEADLSRLAITCKDFYTMICSDFCWRKSLRGRNIEPLNEQARKQIINLYTKYIKFVCKHFPEIPEIPNIFDQKKQIDSFLKNKLSNADENKLRSIIDEVRKEDSEILILLLENGIKPTENTINTAAEHYPQILEVLIQYGAQASTKTLYIVACFSFPSRHINTLAAKLYKEGVPECDINEAIDMGVQQHSRSQRVLRRVPSF